MNQERRYWLLKRGTVYYIEDSTSLDDHSLQSLAESANQARTRHHLNEHQKIVNTETNADRKRHYELRWGLGAARATGLILPSATSTGKTRRSHIHRMKTESGRSPKASAGPAESGFGTKESTISIPFLNRSTKVLSGDWTRSWHVLKDHRWPISLA